MLLYKDIQHISILIDCTPKLMQFAEDLDKHLIEEPRITEFSLSMPNIICVSLTEFQTPLANGLIGDNDTRAARISSTSRKLRAKRKYNHTAWLMISAGYR
jgi:hypothetical protein